MLEQADLLGDKTLMRAVAWRANAVGNDALVRRYLDSDEDGRKSYEAWADAHGELERVESYGTELGLGYAELEEPAEARHPEARAEMAGSLGDAA